MGKQPAAGKKTKDAIMRAASSSSKQGKKKWTKGRVKDKANNAVFFDETLYKRVLADAPKMKLITIPSLVDKFKINGSLARVLLKHLEEKALVKPCGPQHAAFKIYTTTVEKKAVVEVAAKDKNVQKKGKKQ